MKKIITIVITVLLANIAMAQEVSPIEKAKKDLAQIKKLVNVNDEDFDYIETLLVYYYNNGGNPHSKNLANTQIAENVHNKIRAKLPKEVFDVLNEKWLKKNVK